MTATITFRFPNGGLLVIDEQSESVAFMHAMGHSWCVTLDQFEKLLKESVPE